MKQVHTFLHGCWYNYLYQTKSERKIYYISPIVGEKNFGWYIWLGCRGVYELQLFDYLIDKNYEESRFILKYYPHPEDDLYDSFAFCEQVIRNSDLFDDTPITNSSGSTCSCSYISKSGSKEHECLIKGIPKINARKKIDPTFFWVGEIGFVFTDERLLRIYANTQDLLVQYSVSGIHIDLDGKKQQIVAPNEADRNLSGWDITWNFLCVYKRCCSPNGISTKEKYPDQ